MKIEPPAGPPPGTKPEELTPGAKKDAPGVSFAERLQQTTEPSASATNAVEAARSGGPTGPVPAMSTHLDAVGRELQAGTIKTRDQAVGRLVECVLDAKFGGKVPPDSMGAMKNAVAAQIVSDPHLSERIDGLLKKAQGG